MTMKKTFVIMIILVIMSTALTACGDSNERVDNTNEQENNSSTALNEIGVSEENMDTVSTDSSIDEAYGDEEQNTNKHYYRTVRLKSGNSYDLIINLPFESSQYMDYYPTLTFTYNTDTGKIERAVYSTYYPNNSGEESNEFLQEAIDIILSGEGICSSFSNIQTENIDDKLTDITNDIFKLSFDIDISSYFANFDQYVNLCFVENEQDIEGYKNNVYYDVLYNQSDPIPSCEDRDGYFYDEITRRQVEWED